MTATKGGGSRRRFEKRKTRKEHESMKKTLSILLALAMLLTLCAVPALAEEQKTLSLAWAPLTVVNQFCDWSETPFVKAWEAKTGVKLEIVNPADFSVYFASGNYADIIYYQWNKYPGGASKAIEDGIIIPLEDKVAEYAPDYLALLQSDKNWLNQCTTPDKHLYAFNFVRGDRRLLTSNGMFIRADWLKELNMEIPETPDELYNALVAFRDQKGATAPMTCTGWWMEHALDNGMFSSAFGLVKGNYYQLDGKVHYGYSEAAYKGVLEFLHKLYDEKLLDRSYLTMDGTTLTSNMLNGISGAMLHSGGGMAGIVTTARNAGDEGFTMGALPYLVANRGEKAMGGQISSNIPGGAAAISTSCKDVETAMKFLNWGYTKEGATLMNFGVEGESFTLVDGVETYTDLINHNPDGKTMQQALGQYTLAWHEGPFCQDINYLLQYWAMPEQQQALIAFTDNTAEETVLPTLSVPGELTDEYSAIFSEVNTYVREQTVAFISGERSLDEFDAYLQTLKALKVERMVEIYQLALDEFNAR